MIAVLILAAGQAKRMGAVKALLKLPDQSALATIVEHYRFCKIEHIVVVSGYHALTIEAEAARLGIQICRNPDPSQGMLSSIKAGIAHLQTLATKPAFFIHPVDCPLIRPVTLQILRERYLTLKEPKVLVPTFLGQAGHPPLIPYALGTQLLGHETNLPQGLASFLANNHCEEVAVPDSFILQDMDTYKEYLSLKAQSCYQDALKQEEAVELLRIRKVPDKGVQHGLAVGRVAEALARALNQPSCQPWLAFAGGVVHDIAKGQPSHEVRGAKLLVDLGLPRLALLVQDHRDLIYPDFLPLTERELVYLADKYCWGHSWVPIETRFAKKLTEFASDAQACAAIRLRLSHALNLEARLANEIKQDPSYVARKALN